MTAADRSALASIAANTRWANVSDRSAATAPARKASPASLEHWMRKVDPDQRMPYTARVKRAENAKAAHYAKILRLARQAKAAKRSAAAS